MDNATALAALAALAQDSRLAVFRLLVQTGQQGMAASSISHALKLPPSSLSFHLKELAHAGLVRTRQDGRFLIYQAQPDAIQRLLAFLGENCCAGAPCPPPISEPLQG